MNKDRRLGRGLAALLGEPLMDESHPGTRDFGGQAGDAPHASSSEYDDSAASDLLMLAVDEIDQNPFQPRREFGETEIASLAESLKEHDMLQPVLVRRVGSRWQLISGERRLRAALHAGIRQIPARVRDADDRLVAELAIVENLQRKDLNAIEKALSFQRYLREHGCTQDELGNRLKIDRSTIANLLRLLELPEDVQSALRQAKISAGHAKALLPLGDDREQIEFCERIQREGMSVREVEKQVQQRVAESDGRLPLRRIDGPKKMPRTGQIGMMEQELRRALGTRVDLQTGARGKGKITIHFKNPQEFERILAYLVDDSLSQRAVTS